MISFLGHLVFLGAGTFFSGSPEYGVEQAPRSVEVVLVKKPLPEQKKVNQPMILSSEKSRSEEQVKIKKREAEVQKSIPVPPQRGAVTEPKPVHLKNPAPVYPELARERGWEGTVFLKVLVGQDGRVREIEVHKSSGHEVLDDCALTTVKKWQFVPAKMGHLTFSSSIIIPVKFMLVEGN